MASIQRFQAACSSLLATPQLALAMALCGLAPALQAQLTTAPVPAEASFELDRVVVVLAPRAADFGEQVDLSNAFLSDPAMAQALADFGAHSMFRVFRSGGVAPRDPKLFADLGMARHYVIELREGSDLGAALRAFSAAPSVESARLDGIVRTSDTPNDPLFPNQWDHRQASDADLDTDLAWEVSTSNASVIVAVIDTGCDYNHPEIAPALLQGYNFVANTTNAQDDHGHGTACAGILGARRNNNADIAGVASDCTILPLKALSANGSGSYSNVAAAITFAANNGAGVISMSLGGPCCDAGVDAALQYAASLDTLSVAATGNFDQNNVQYPGSSPWCLAVGASSPCDERKNPASCDGENFWGSNYGSSIDVVAPGVLIPTITLGGGNTLVFNGTSAATPHVAGIAAIVRALDPTLTYADVHALILNAAQDQVGPPSEDTPGFDIYFGYGRANAHRAALAAIGARTFCPADGTGTLPTCGNLGGPDVGARNTTGNGAQFNASGSPSVAADDLVLTGTQLPGNKLCIILMAPAMNNGGAGTPFFDGLLCLSSGSLSVFRHAPRFATPGGVVTLGPGIVQYSCTHFNAAACIQPGSVWNFQAWYRDQGGPCSTAANTSNAVGVTFRP